MDKFTLEEIYLIKSCNMNDREQAIEMLKSYDVHADPDLQEIVKNTIHKLQKIESQEEFLALCNYSI